MIPLGPLYHYTCEHRARLIREDGSVRPGWQLGAPPEIPWARFAWFTDMAVPARDALGLTSEILTCDRTEYRFEAAYVPPELVPWVSVRQGFRWAEYLESAPGARPAHWWVSDIDVSALWVPPKVTHSHYGPVLP